MPYPAPTVPGYRKTKSGAFAVFGPASLVAEGLTEITLKSGKTKQEMIRGLGAIFDVKGTPCRYGYLTASTATPATSTPTSQPTVKIDLSAESFMPDEAYVGEDDVPAAYEDTDQFAEEFTDQHA